MGSTAGPTGSRPRVVGGGRWPRAGALPTATVLLAAYNVVVTRLLPEQAYVPANLVAAAAGIGLARAGGTSWDELGLDTARLPAAARQGAVAAAGCAAVVLAVRAVPATRTMFTDARASGTGRGRASYDVLVRIPLGTALAEEMLFRGVLIGLGRRAGLSRRRAMVLSSALFGAWHVLPALDSIRTNAAASALAGKRAGPARVVAGTVLSTAATGVSLAVLRQRAGHLLAPTAAHAAVNAAAYGAARFGRPRLREDPRLAG